MSDCAKPYRGKISKWGIIPFIRSTNIDCYVIVGEDERGEFIRTSPIINMKLPFRNAKNTLSEVETENHIYILDGPSNHTKAQAAFNLIYGTTL